MHRTKINTVILLSLVFSASLMGIFAYENYNENNIGYTVIFFILCLLFIVLTIYGLVRNSN